MKEIKLTKQQIQDHDYYSDIVEFLDLTGIEATYIEYNTVWRFKQNSIVRYLLDYHAEETKKIHGTGGGLNLICEIGIKEGYTLREYVELYIHMGYSLGGFLEVYGESIDQVLRIRHDAVTGDFIDKLGPTDESIALLDKPRY